MKKILFLVIVVGVVAAVILLTKTERSNEMPVVDNGAIQENVVEKTEQAVKEFSMTSFVDVIDGKYYPQYSLKEITVNKGDLVRIKITMTKGMHDFNLDQFGIKEFETPLDKEAVVEFTADKAGEFIYYCSKPGHRTNGHWGTLKVL